MGYPERFCHRETSSYFLSMLKGEGLPLTLSFWPW